MFISNYIYDKVGQKRKRIMQYHSAMPTERVFTWEEMGNMRLGHYILMHSVIYRTGLLRECGSETSETHFLCGQHFCIPAPSFCEKLYYLDAEFYHYFIGREDQSVNETIMIGRIDQQIRVNKIMIDFMARRNIKGKRLRNYMMSYLDIITTVSSVLLLRSGTDENFEKKQELWQYLKRADLRLYYKLRQPPGTGHEPAGQGRKKGFCCRLPSDSEILRFQLKKYNKIRLLSNFDCILQEKYDY